LIQKLAEIVTAAGGETNKSRSGSRTNRRGSTSRGRGSSKTTRGTRSESNSKAAQADDKKKVSWKTVATRRKPQQQQEQRAVTSRNNTNENSNSKEYRRLILQKETSGIKAGELASVDKLYKAIPEDSLGSIKWTVASYEEAKKLKEMATITECKTKIGILLDPCGQEQLEWIQKIPKLEMCAELQKMGVKRLRIIPLT